MNALICAIVTLLFRGKFSASMSRNLSLVHPWTGVSRPSATQRLTQLYVWPVSRAITLAPTSDFSVNFFMFVSGIVVAAAG